MSTSFTVEHRKNTGKGASRRLRSTKNGSLPQNAGVVYGSSEPISVAMNSYDALKLISDNQKSDSKLFDLVIKNLAEKPLRKKVILQDYQLSPVGKKLLHVDFREVTPSLVITMSLPVKTVGTSKAEKLGGIVQLSRYNLAVKGKVKDLPPTIDVDVSDLNFGDSIQIKDLKFPKGVAPVLAGDDNFTVISVSAAPSKEEEEEEALPAESPSEEKE